MVKYMALPFCENSCVLEHNITDNYRLTLHVTNSFSLRFFRYNLR